MAAEVGIAVAGPAETMAEEDNGRRTVVAGEPDAHGDRAFTPLVNHIEIERRRQGGGKLDREGVVGRISRKRHRRHSQQASDRDEEPKHQHGRPSRVITAVVRAITLAGEFVVMPAVLPRESHGRSDARADEADDDEEREPRRHEVPLAVGVPAPLVA